MADSAQRKPSVSAEEAIKADQELNAGRGYGWPEWRWLASKDPVYAKVRADYSKVVFTRQDGELPVRYRELIEAVILAYRGFPTVGAHIRRALREGATFQECIEAFETATIPGGMPVLHYGLQFLMEVEKELAENK